MYAACDLRLFLAIYDVGRAHGTAKGHENRGRERERERARGKKRDRAKGNRFREIQRNSFLRHASDFFLQSRAVVSQSEDRI